MKDKIQDRIDRLEKQRAALQERHAALIREQQAVAGEYLKCEGAIAELQVLLLNGEEEHQ